MIQCMKPARMTAVQYQLGVAVVPCFPRPKKKKTLQMMLNHPNNIPPTKNYEWIVLSTIARFGSIRVVCYSTPATNQNQLVRLQPSEAKSNVLRITFVQLTVLNCKNRPRHSPSNQSTQKKNNNNKNDETWLLHNKYLLPTNAFETICTHWSTFCK